MLDNLIDCSIIVLVKSETMTIHLIFGHFDGFELVVQPAGIIKVYLCCESFLLFLNLDLMHQILNKYQGGTKL